MKRNVLKQMLALAAAAAVAVSSMPTAVAFAEEDMLVASPAVEAAADDVTNDVTNDVMNDVMEETVYETFDAEAAGEEIAVEEAAEDVEATISIESFEEIEVGEEVEAELSDFGMPGTPPQVTGAALKTTWGDEPCTPYFVWSIVPNSYKYEIEITDASGNVYCDGFDSVKNTYKYAWVKADHYNEWDDCYFFLEDYNLKAYAADGTIIKDGANDLVIKPSAAYAFRVRAVYGYEAPGTGIEVYTPGPWSEAVSYTTLPEIVRTPINDLQFVREEEEGSRLCFTYATPVPSGRVYYQVATDPTFAAAVIVREDSSLFAGSKLVIPIYYYTDLERGVTYYIRAYAASSMLNETEIAQLGLNPIAVTVPEKPAVPKNITGLELVEAYTYSLDVRFDAVLETGDRVKFEYCTTSDPTWKNVAYSSINTNECTVDIYSWPDTDTLSLRATAYCWDSKTAAYVYGTPSNILTVPPKAKPKTVSTISSITLKSIQGGYYTFEYVSDLHEDECIEVWYSTEPTYADTEFLTVKKVYYDENDKTFTLGDLTPGKTYYARARVRNEQSVNSDTLKGDSYSAFVDIPAFTVVMPRVTLDTSLISATSIALSVCGADGCSVELQKKVGKSWVTLIRTTDNYYTDSKLKKDTNYSYRARAVCYDKKTGTYSEGQWAYVDAVTWGNALKLKAVPASATSIKLSWKKVAGASGYEIYRSNTYSDGQEAAEGTWNDFSGYTKVKTIKKAKTTKYTDKKLTSGLDYSYIVCAYKTVGKKKYIIKESAAASLAFTGSFGFKNMIVLADGTMKVLWDADFLADGFRVEVYDNEKDIWTLAAILPKSASQYVFPAVTGEKSVDYRVCAFKGNEFSGYDTVTVSPFLAAPTGVQAAANQADGSITVTWNPVAGADFYRVFRTTSSKAYFYKDSGDYDNANGKQLPIIRADATQKSGYSIIYDEDLKETSIVDRTTSYNKYDGSRFIEHQGPCPGVKYYYYVVAYKYSKPYVHADNHSYYVNSGESRIASAMLSSVTAGKTSIKKVTAGKKKATVTYKTVEGAVRYNVYYSLKKGSGYTLGATSASGKATVTGLQKGKKYYFKVAAVTKNEAGSDVVSAMSGAKRSKAIK